MTELFSTGHSNYPFEEFARILTMHEVEVVADVRTVPVSGYSPHFSQQHLRPGLADAGIGYVFLGVELGGRPDGDQFYDKDGRVRYDQLALSPLFEKGLDRLLDGADKYRIAIMCSEECPDNCHRHMLVGEVLRDRGGVEIRHIRRAGALMPDAAIPLPNRSTDRAFWTEEESLWKSTLPVLQGGPPGTSSEH